MGRRSNARERLVDAARELMHERGYTAVGVAELCEKAAVNKGSFYYLFPSKRELALEVIDTFGIEAEENLRAVAGGDDPPLERLRRHFDDTYRTHRSQRQRCERMIGCPVGNLALEMSTQDDVVRERLSRVLDLQVERLAAVVTEAVERGDVPPLEPRRAARALVSLLEGAVMLAKTRDDPELLEGLGDDALRLLGASVQG